jgi:phage shock protein A
LSGFTQNLRELKSMADAHRQSLGAARNDLQQFESAVQRLKAATEGTQEQARVAIPQFREAFNTFALKTAATGDKSLDTMMATDECRDRLQVKVDQVRAHYN